MKRPKITKLFSVFLGLVMALCLNFGPAHAAGTLPSKAEGQLALRDKYFSLVTDVDPRILLEIRYYSAYNFVGERIDGYKAPVAYLTKQAALALKAANDEFYSKGYTIKVYDAYRPQTAVNHFVRWGKNLQDVKMKSFFYPQVDKSELFNEGYIAAKSGHSKGSTIDLTIVNLTTGKELDVGEHFDFFGEISHPDSKQVSAAQYNNRMLLQQVMVRHGFRALDTEWWHFTLNNEPFTDTYFDFPVE